MEKKPHIDEKEKIGKLLESGEFMICGISKEGKVLICSKSDLAMNCKEKK